MVERRVADLLGVDDHFDRRLLRNLHVVPLDAVLLRPLHGLLVLVATCRLEAWPQGACVSLNPCDPAEGSRRRSLSVTFRVLVVPGDVIDAVAADGLGVDTLPDVGGVQKERRHLSILVLLVTDHVAVHLERKSPAEKL